MIHSQVQQEELCKSCHDEGRSGLGSAMRTSKRQQQRKEEKERNRNRLEEYWQYDESLLYLTPPLVCDAASSCDDADGHGANTLMAGSAIIAFDMVRKTKDDRRRKPAEGERGRRKLGR